MVRASVAPLAVAPACLPAWDCWPFPVSGLSSRPAGWRQRPLALWRVPQPVAWSARWLALASPKPTRTSIGSPSGTLVSVRVKDEDAGRVEAILDRYEPVNPAVRAAEYRKEGWTTFDPDAPPYRPSESEIDRIRRVR